MAAVLHAGPALLPSSMDLAEDFLGAWSPDPAGRVDVGEYGREIELKTSYVAQTLDVPRPGAKKRARVRILHPGWHVALHDAVLPLRDAIDERLAPGVFGYRRGADAGRRYADDWRAFCQFVDRLSDEHALLVLTDVKTFFAATPWSLAIRAIESLIGPSAGRALSRTALALARANVARLPTGYSDARMLANAVLAGPDQRLNVPFARWIDDYRIFVRDASQAESAVASLDAGLRRLGLERNATKTRLMPARDAVERHHKTLASVYHPDRDPADIAAARLQALFDQARTDPIANRRQLRFTLPRLAEQRNPVAIPFALHGLRVLPWEAPRLALYLSAFVENSDVHTSVSDLLTSAAAENDAWLVCRLTPLAAMIELSRDCLRALEQSYMRFVGTPAWGAALRLFSVHRVHGPVLRALHDENADVRAVITAARDLDIRVPRRLREAEPVLAKVLETQVAPLPSADTLL